MINKVRNNMKDKLINLGKQRSTWVGVAALLVAGVGLPAGSEEQVIALLVGIVGVIYPEKVDK